MTLLEWWIEYGDKYGIPYDVTCMDCRNPYFSTVEVNTDKDAILIISNKVTSGYDYRSTVWELSDKFLYDNEEEEIQEPAKYVESRNRNISRSEGKELMSNVCYTAIDNIIDGKTSLQPVSTAFPAFYDVTDWVAVGSREVTPTERMTGIQPTARYTHVDDRASDPTDWIVYEEYIEGSYLRVYNAETKKIEYRSTDGKTLFFEVDSTMSNREAFFREVLPDKEPRKDVTFVPGHNAKVYVSGDYEWKYVKPHAEYADAESRESAIARGDLSPVDLVSQLRNAGFIVKVGNRDILICATDDEGYYIDFKEAMKQFNNKGHDVTGLTFRQEVQMLLSQGTLHTRALDGKEFNIDEVIEAGRIELERAGAKLSRSDYPWQMQKVEDKEDTSKSYWEIREAQNEQAWLDIAESTANMQDKMLTRCCNDVIDKLNKFYESIEAGHVPTRGELLRNEQYRQTILAIQSKLSSEGQQNLTVIKGSMEQIVKTVNISVLTKGMINATVNTEYKGENYSSRVWNNTRTLATRLESTIEDCIIAGRNIQEATTKIEHEFSVARYQAERLLRTETARVYTRATEDSFASAGIDEVKILVERGACEECAKLKGKTWKRGEQPTLPIHPNCRCALAPVVKARYTRKEK